MLLLNNEERKPEHGDLNTLWSGSTQCAHFPLMNSSARVRWQRNRHMDSILSEHCVYLSCGRVNLIKGGLWEERVDTCEAT